MKPLQTLTFTLGVIALLAGAMWLMPDDGFEVGDMTFHMPTFSEMIVGDDVEYTDVSKLLLSSLKLIRW